MANSTIRSVCRESFAFLRARIVQLLDGRVSVTNEGDPNTARLANAFESFATTIQTRLDSGGLSDGLGGSTLQQQVQRALSEVLGRSAVRGSAGFGRALNEVFPVGPDGKVSSTPSRGLVSIYAPSAPYGTRTGYGAGSPWPYGGVNGSYGTGYGAGSSPPYGDSNGSYGASSGGPYGIDGAGPLIGTGYAPGAGGSGLGSSIIPEQAVLYRQASRVATEVISVLRAIQPRSTTVDLAEVDALRGIIEADIRSLVEEFGRLDGPRDQRVRLYLEALIGSSTALIGSSTLRTSSTASTSSAVRTNSHVGRFTDLIRRSDVSPTGEFTSLDEESVEASLGLLERDAESLARFFEEYTEAVAAAAEQAGGGRPFAQQVIDAGQLLPAIAETNTNFIAALEAIGFTSAERRVTRIDVGVPVIDSENDLVTDTGQPSPILISDLTDWIEQFAGQQGPYLVDALGQFGLDFVADQADALFFIVASILVQTASIRLNLDRNVAQLPAELSDERVQNELTDLLIELDRLASVTA